VREKRIEDIEFLRAVAIIFVVTAHLPALVGWYGVDITRFQQYFALGSGVDLFLVISGFVITRSFINHNGGTIPTDFRSSAIPFWTRRAFRILPAAWFWIAASLFATVALNSYGNFGTLLPNLHDGIAGLLQIANIIWWSCDIRWNTLCAEGGIPNGIYWTLSLEEQFYLMFPFVLVFTPRRFLVPLLLIVAAVLLYGQKDELARRLRFDGLLIGVLLGLASFHPIYQRLKPTFLEQPWRRWLALAVFIPVVLIMDSSLLDNIADFQSGMLVLICGLWVFVASHGYAMPRSPLTPLFLWVGSRSYALYLTHIMAYCTTREIWMAAGLTGTGLEANFRYLVLAGTILFLFAEGTHQYIERPMKLRGAVLAGRMRPVAT
jgi:peptidoglycan/LPS O-acetylase OafA/YrhL